MNKNDVCVIRAKLKDDYVWNAIKGYGFKIYIPYKDKNILLRLMREVWFRLGLPKKDYWFNRELKTLKESNIIVYDPLVTPDLLTWLRRQYPYARIILSYENRADSTINPTTVDKSIEVWSYDHDDCKKYGMRFISPNFFDVYGFDSRVYEKKWDVLYLGRDKGRLQQILSYEQLFREHNLRTHFHICADRAYLKYKNKIYKNVLTYKEYLELLKNSNSILNITRDGQSSITQREMEAVFFNIKCITTNKAIKNFELYDSSRYFILGVDDIKNLNQFLSCPFLEVESQKLTEYMYETVVCKMLDS